MNILFLIDAILVVIEHMTIVSNRPTDIVDIVKHTILCYINNLLKFGIGRHDNVPAVVADHPQVKMHCGTDEQLSGVVAAPDWLSARYVFAVESMFDGQVPDESLVPACASARSKLSADALT